MERSRADVGPRHLLFPGVWRPSTLAEASPAPPESYAYVETAALQEGSHKLLLHTSLRARRARRRATRSKPKPSTYLVPTLEGRAREPLWAETWCGISQGRTPWTAGKTCVLIDYAWADECRTGTRLDVTAADARGAGAFSTLLLVGSMLLIAGFIVARKAARTAESEPLLATTA